MVYFRMYGRLGNFLFQYATALSLGKGRVVAVVEDDVTLADIKKYPSLFGGLEIVRSAPVGIRHLKQGNIFDLVDTSYIEQGDVLLDGYFQSEKYIDRDIVRQAYAMPEGLERQLKERYAAALSVPQVTSIHVRRGDYLKLPQFHPFVGEKYFIKALARLSDCHEYIVCSDDLAWCKAFFPPHFPDCHFTFSQEKGPLEDIYLCSLCHNHILSNSSFSWWGAWLNERPDKRILAPSNWFGFALAKGLKHDWSPIYLPGTEVISNSPTFSFWWHAHWMYYKFKRADRRERHLRRKIAAKLKV